MSGGAEALAQAAAVAAQQAAAAGVGPLGAQLQAEVNPGGAQVPEAALGDGGEAWARWGSSPSVVRPGPDSNQCHSRSGGDSRDQTAVQ